MDPKWSICPPLIIFFSGKLLISFSSTYWPLSLCKILKKFFQRIQNYEDVQFLGPKWPISPNENFFRKPVNEPCFLHSCLLTCQKSNSSTYKPPSCSKFKNIFSSGSRIMRMCNFWVQNDPFPQMRIFFRKPVNKHCLFHSCLSTCQKSKSDINLLVKY